MKTVLGFCCIFFLKKLIGAQAAQKSGPTGGHVPHNPQGLKQTSILPHATNIPPHILQQLYAGNEDALIFVKPTMNEAKSHSFIA